MNLSTPTGGCPSVLVCSFEFGQGLGAEGLCTERLIGGLLDHGWQITVAASERAKPTLLHDRLRIHHFADRPGTVRAAELLARALHHYLEPNWSWRRRLLRAGPGGSADFIYGRGMPWRVYWLRRL